MATLFHVASGHCLAVPETVEGIMTHGLPLCRSSQQSCTLDRAYRVVNGRPAPSVRVGHSPSATARLSAPSFFRCMLRTMNSKGE